MVGIDKNGRDVEIVRVRDKCTDINRFELVIMIGFYVFYCHVGY